jgi:hypothetical protein
MCALTTEIERLSDEQSCSIGVPGRDGHGTIAVPLHRTDQTMYRANDAGHDQGLATEDPQANRLADPTNADLDRPLTAIGGAVTQ